LGKVGDKLTEIAHSFGPGDIYIGDDNKIHFMGEGSSVQAKMKCHKRASLNKRSESLMEKIKHEIKTEIEKQDKRDGNPFEIGSTLGGETEVYDFAIKDDLDALLPCRRSGLKKLR
jgi:hypothetical protein